MNGGRRTQGYAERKWRPGLVLSTSSVISDDGLTIFHPQSEDALLIVVATRREECCECEEKGEYHNLQETSGKKPL